MIALVIAAGVVTAVSVSLAAITTPTNNATVRGDVFINEDRGGIEDALCGLFGAHANSTITVTRDIGSVVVLNQSKGSAGAWSTTWYSQNELSNGFYTIKSTAKDVRSSNLCIAKTTTLSTFKVYLENFIPFVDDRGAGTILINPFLKMFRFTTSSYDSGNKSDPNMNFQGVPQAPPVPSAPSAPSVNAACTDPTGSGFLPYILLNGPQGCVSPNPVPVVKVPPDPPNPPPAPASQCDVPGTAGCHDQVIVISFDDAAISLDGTFDMDTRAFAASVITKPDNTPYALGHTPTPPA